MYLKVIIFILSILFICLLFKTSRKPENFVLKSRTRRKNLVFTSAGDKTNFVSHWLNDKKNRNFDIWVIYYGNSPLNKYKSEVDYWERRKGSKFQNFYYLWEKYKHTIKSYRKIFILDDDIIMKTKDINKCFQMSYQYNLWLMQPSFLPSSKLSFDINKRKQNTILRYTNFVEINTPLIDISVLDDIMKKYNPILVGWGIDLLMSWVLINRPDYNSHKIAILDNVWCINPHDRAKGNVREISKLQPTEKRAGIYKLYAQRNNINFTNKDIKTLQYVYK